jgi:hypothetical protein
MEEKQTSASNSEIPSRVALRDLLVEMKHRDKLFENYIDVRGQIHNRWIMLVGLIAVIAGLWMAWLIHRMMDDMELMSSKMVAMEGYMHHMQVDIASMNTSMHSMEGSMVSMRGYIEVMSGDMSAMRNDIASVPEMQKDVGRMSKSVNLMQYDTGIMRSGVATMSHDMGTMSIPFRALNTVTPW